MSDLKPDKWNPADLDVLLTDVIAAVESGEIDSAFDNTELTSGHLTKAKNTRNYTKNYLSACIRAGVNGVAEASRDTALGLVNAFRQMNAEPPLEVLPENYKVFAVKLPCADGNPDVEIYIKDGDRVLYGEKILPRGVLTENFLDVTGSSLFQNRPDDAGSDP
ncbi:MAG: hypothetical protein PVJ25_05945 [Desulfuromonadales bacterium]|jgi:hypothetical protein